ncbi:MAG: hypothetical protein IKW13_05975 [Thermoguttaceae bacterium]|nr:hypothetical protein [Thermoguttaceae bacterium]
MHNCTKRPEDRRFGRLSKEASCPNAGACASFRRFPKIEMELLFSRPPGEAAGWRKNFLALFDAANNVDASATNETRLGPGRRKPLP